MLINKGLAVTWLGLELVPPAPPLTIQDSRKHQLWIQNSQASYKANLQVPYPRNIELQSRTDRHLRDKLKLLLGKYSQ